MFKQCRVPVGNWFILQELIYYKTFKQSFKRLVVGDVVLHFGPV